MFFFCLFWRTFSLHFPPEFNRSQGENTTKGLVTLEIINLIFCILVCLILVGCFCSGVFFIFFSSPLLSLFLKLILLKQSNLILIFQVIIRLAYYNYWKVFFFPRLNEL